MTINFALSLSLAGIDLLQRTDSGWRRVGTASLLAKDIGAELADLRVKGQALAPDGFYTKLVIPMEQVKYLAIDTTQTTLADITAALDGTTPYALDELAIDFERSGGRTHIAAVARETLREAEDFAHAHGFNPVALVAVPDHVTFAKEIFFGPTTMAARILGAGVTVERDALPVTLVGTRIKSHLLMQDIAESPTPAAVAPPLAPLCDRIIGEYHAPRMPDPVAPVIVRMVLGTAAPSVPAHLDPIIVEHHQPATQIEVPLIAVPTPGSPRPVVLGGVVAKEPRAIVRRPLPAFAIPGAIAAGIAALGFVWWLGSAQAPVETPLANATQDGFQTAPAPALVDIAIAAPNLDALDDTLPAGDTPVATSPAPLPLRSDDPDSLIADLQPAPQPDATTPLQAPASNGRVLSADEAAAAYAATGVWQRPPRFADLPPAVVSEDVILPVNLAAPDRMSIAALPSIEALATDLSFVPLANPPAPDVVFDLDEDGFVTATPEGALTPDGAVVYAGLPDMPFRARPVAEPEATLQPDDEDIVAETQPDADAQVADAVVQDGTVEVPVITGRPPVVPPLRPADIAADDAVEDATPGGVSLAGLQPDAVSADAVVDLAPPPGAIRPQARPALPDVANSASEVEAVLGGIALATPDPRATGSALAVATSLRPTSRPTNFDRVVAAVRSRQQPAAAPEPAPAPSPGAIAAAPAPEPEPEPQPQVQAAAPVAPQNYEPVPGGVARAATQDNAIRLREINLIGVFGQPSARRALVRLGNGQLVRVQVGSELDGGQVTAIGENALNYVKRGTTYALQIPRG
ncbi:MULTISPECIES: hypothetical protein [unclassified Yoonia]|uniref:hypothetical protein n=1 Tax=unclassified Yoonia TaxID=2629118 RepID=UPI002AFF1C85|nr:MULTISPECIES: hypothetical protein [unclassified Yoonia]